MNVFVVCMVCGSEMEEKIFNGKPWYFCKNCNNAMPQEERLKMIEGAEHYRHSKIRRAWDDED